MRGQLTGNKKARTQIPSAAPKPQLRPVKTIQNIAAKTADSVAEIAADMAGGLGNIVNIGTRLRPARRGIHP